MAIGVNTAQNDVHAAGVTGDSPLHLKEVGGVSEVYVALLPTRYSDPTPEEKPDRTFNFTVTNASGTYTGTAKATLVEGEYVEATGLKLTKQ